MGAAFAAGCAAVEPARTPGPQPADLHLGDRATYVSDEWTLRFEVLGTRSVLRSDGVEVATIAVATWERLGDEQGGARVLLIAPDDGSTVATWVPCASRREETCTGMGTLYWGDRGAPTLAGAPLLRSALLDTPRLELHRDCRVCARPAVAERIAADGSAITIRVNASYGERSARWDHLSGELTFSDDHAFATRLGLPQRTWDRVEATRGGGPPLRIDPSPAEASPLEPEAAAGAYPPEGTPLPKHTSFAAARRAAPPSETPKVCANQSYERSTDPDGDALGRGRGSRETLTETCSLASGRIVLLERTRFVAEPSSASVPLLDEEWEFNERPAADDPALDCSRAGVPLWTLVARATALVELRWGVRHIHSPTSVRCGHPEVVVSGECPARGEGSFCEAELVSISVETGRLEYANVYADHPLVRNLPRAAGPYTLARG